MSSVDQPAGERVHDQCSSGNGYSGADILEGSEYSGGSGSNEASHAPSTVHDPNYGKPEDDYGDQHEAIFSPGSPNDPDHVRDRHRGDQDDDERDHSNDQSVIDALEAAPIKAQETASATEGVPPKEYPSQIYETGNFTEVADDFDQMNLREELLRGIYAYGFERPSDIQRIAIIPCIKGNDIIFQARAGTGNTTASAVAVLQRIDISNKGCQALFLVTTRELAHWLKRGILNLGDYMSLQGCACVAGNTIRENILELRNGAQVVVGTPGKVYDMISRRLIVVRNIKLVVFDEMDELLSRGFKDQIDDIFKTLGDSIQVIVMSATMPAEVLEMTERMVHNPVRITLKKEVHPLELAQQFFINVENEEWKLDTLCDLFEVCPRLCVIYCNTTRKVEWLAEQMRGRAFSVSVMHEDMDQEERYITKREFRGGSTTVLVTTDVVVPEAEIQRVGLVINFELPTNRENYIRRIGRRSRLGKKEIVISLVATEEAHIQQDIETFYNTQIEELTANIFDLF